MNEKQQIREALKSILDKRYDSLESIKRELKNHLSQPISMTKVKVVDLLDDEDYRIDVIIGIYVGSIWYLKTRNKKYYITDAMLD